MASTLQFLADWADATWIMVVESALLLLVSFVLAGLLHLVLNARTIGKIISGGKRREILKTALVGVPLPLCSCSVLPVAYQLRQAGVSRAGTTSFLISTPETGVDSILLTWTLMDPLMTVARPIAAFFTAVAAGTAEATFHREDKTPVELPTAAESCADGCACSPSPTGTATAQAVLPVTMAPPTPAPPRRESLPAKLMRAVRYGFGDLLHDLAVYLLVGYALAGLVVAIFGSSMLALPAWLTSGWGGYVGAIVVGLPLYICATSSTPLAAALLVAGFSPGAVLVFLLVGPATNVASLAVVSKILKGWGTIRYLLSIVVVAILFGLLIDYFYRSLGISAMFRGGEGEEHAWYHVAAGVLFVLLLLRSLYRKASARLRRSSA